MKNVSIKINNNITFNGVISTPNFPTDKIILHIHGMAGSYLEHNFYPEMHNFYPQNGISFLAVEHSGTGINGAATERFEQCVEDISDWINYVVSLGYKEIWIQSHSLGTSKVAYYMNQTKDDRVKGLVFISPSEMNGLVHDPIGQLDYDAMYPEAKDLMVKNIPDQILKHKLWESVEMSAGTFLNMFDDGSNSAIFNYANPKLGWDVVNNISIPVLAISGTNDDGIVTVMDANKAMDLLKSELLHSPRVKTIVYENAAHDFEGFENYIVRDVTSFILFSY